MIDNFIQDDIGQYHSYDCVYNHQNGNLIFLGDASSANDLQFIKKQQIKLIVTAATNMDHLSYDQHIKHITYSMLDSKTQNIAQHFTNFYILIEEQILKGNILVHCFAGVSRSATLIISYIMKKNKLNFKQAIAFVRKNRPTVIPNLGFQRQLKQYEKTLKVQQMQQTRKFISKTSQSRKHQQKKLPQIGLPQIFALGKTMVRQHNIQPPPILQPSSQMQSRKMRIGNFELVRQITTQQGKSNQSQFMYQPLTNRLPIKSFRNRSISINKKFSKNIHESEHPVELARLPPHKLAVQQLKFGTERIIKSVALKDLYH